MSKSPSAEDSASSASRPSVFVSGRGNPRQYSFSVEPSLRYALHYHVRIKGADRPNGAVIDVTYVDSVGNTLDPPYPSFRESTTFKAFRYLSCRAPNLDAPHYAVIETPPGAARMDLRLRPWGVRTLEVCSELVLRALGRAGSSETLPSSKHSTTFKSTPSPKVQQKRGDEIASVGTETTAGALLHVKCTVAFLKADERGAILTVQYWDERFNLLTGPYPGFFQSDTAGQYRYLPLSTSDNGLNSFAEVIDVPDGAVYAMFSLRRWNSDITLRSKLDIEQLRWEDYIKSIDSSKLSALSLRQITNQAVRRGDLKSARSTCAYLYRREKNESDGYRLQMLNGQWTELETRWIPRVKSGLPQDSSRDGILHLFKVIYPQESSGGAVRNWDVVRCQAQVGLRPVVSLSVSTELPATLAADGVLRDGIFEEVRDGVLISCPRFSGFKRSQIPPDILLEAEANLAANTLLVHGCGIVHATSGFKGFDNALKGMALAKRFNLPLVYEVRSFHEHTWGPPTSEILGAPITRMRLQQEKRCMLGADAVITISEAMVEHLVARGIPRDKIYLVPNAVREDFLSPADPAGAEKLKGQLGLSGRVVLGYVSNMSAREGHSVLLKAFARIAAQNPNLVCLMVGNGREYNRLKLLGEQLGVSDRLIMPGELDHSTIKEVYSLIDVFVVPRIADFAADFVTPMKPFEALAMGCRLIMSDRPVAGEVVGKEERGLLFKTGDDGDLARKITAVLRNDAAARSRASVGRAWIKNERTWDRNAQIYASIYSELRERYGINAKRAGKEA